jgi:hypothetical protein
MLPRYSMFYLENGLRGAQNQNIVHQLCAQTFNENEFSLH